jgi:serine protease Do
MKIILTIILLFTYIPTAHAREPLKTTEGYLYINDTIKANIENLKKHTVIVMLQKDGLAYRGAGIAIDKRHILTVNHVAAADTEGSNNYYRAEENGLPYDCKVIKQDKEHDIAILEIESKAPDLPNSMTFATEIQAGETIYTIGHPLSGLYSLTMGKTSNTTGRLNLKVNGGNSGGFVMNDQGELVGMVTSKQNQVGNLAYMVGKDDIISFIGG